MECTDSIYEFLVILFANLFICNTANQTLPLHIFVGCFIIILGLWEVSINFFSASQSNLSLTPIYNYSTLHILIPADVITERSIISAVQIVTLVSIYCLFSG
jgi:hypothetical protein